MLLFIAMMSQLGLLGKDEYWRLYNGHIVWLEENRERILNTLLISAKSEEDKERIKEIGVARWLDNDTEEE